MFVMKHIMKRAQEQTAPTNKVEQRLEVTQGPGASEAEQGPHEYRQIVGQGIDKIAFADVVHAPDMDSPETSDGGKQMETLSTTAPRWRRSHLPWPDRARLRLA
jgi:hypothetical protein